MSKTRSIDRRDKIRIIRESDGFFNQVYRLVARIPEGSVATYGQIASLLGRPKGSRLIGWALKASPGELQLPCHRVVNRLGTLAPDYVFGSGKFQRSLLEKEGITFREDGTIDVKKHIWKPDLD